MTAKNRNKLVGSSFVLFFIGVLVLLLNAQATYNWRFQSAAGGVSATGNSIWYHVNAAPTSFPKLAWTLTGSLASCTVQIDFSNDGSTVAGQAVAAQTCTASGSFTAGAANVYNYVRASYVIGSGGGSISYIGTGCINGTCTSGGSGTTSPGGANTNVQYNNVNAFGGNSGLTYDGSHTLSLGSAGGGVSTLSLAGNTSGNVTITAPAVAGTITNPITFSNVLLTTAGSPTALAYAMPGNASNNYGMYYSSNALGPGFSCGAATGCIIFSGTGGFSSIYTRSDFSYGWSSTTSPESGGPDVKVSRLAPKVITIDSSTRNDETGLIRDAHACRITADVSLTVNTANSFCSYSLPAVAKAWSFNCDIQWAITAGSGTNNFALGVNASQTPTGTTNAIGQIYTTTTGTQTLGSAAISASGATSILTGATYTPAATVQLAHISGTVLASATAGTFAITATANGTTATAAVKAGSQCQIF